MYSDGSALEELSKVDILPRLRTIGLSSWAPGTRDHFTRITPVILTGRHLHADRTRAGSGV